MTGDHDTARGNGEGATPELDGDALLASIPSLSDHTGLEAEPSSTSRARTSRSTTSSRSAARRATPPAAASESSSPTAPTRSRRRRCSATSSTTPRRQSSSPERSGRPPPPAPTARRTPSTRSASPPARPPRGMGVLVCFGGEIHHARGVRKTDTTSLVAFSSPQTGPLGRVSEGHPTIWSRIPRNPPLDPPNLDARVLIVPSVAGDDGTLAQAALDTDPAGVVIGTLGAGHLTPVAARHLQGGGRADRRSSPTAAPSAASSSTPPTATADPSATCATPGSSRPASSRRRRRG